MVTSAAARPRRLGAGALVTVVALAAAVAVPAALVRAPLVTTAVVVGAVAGLATLLKLEWAVLLFVALAPFEDWAAAVSGASVKLAGLLVFAAWALRVLGDRTRRKLHHPTVSAATVLLLVCLAAAIAHPRAPDTVTVLVRYLSFIGALVVLVDALRSHLSPARVAAVYVTACVLASLGGLYGSVVLGHYRAAGPIGDANDLAFFLVAAFPLALALRARGRRTAWLLAAFVLLAGVAGTLSRGGALALAVMGAWAFARGHLRARTALVTVAFVSVALALVALLLPALVTEKLRAKDKVAETNVVERKVRWVVAAEMTVDHPLLGIGPGGFVANYDRYAGSRDPNPTHQLTVAHEMYLEVSAELGLLGLVAFLAVIGHGYTAAGRARRRLPRGPDRALAAGVQASIVGICVAAVFLTEQYFLPVWLLPALGAGLELRTDRA